MSCNESIPHARYPFLYKAAIRIKFEFVDFIYALFLVRNYNTIYIHMYFQLGQTLYINRENTITNYVGTVQVLLKWVRG